MGCLPEPRFWETESEYVGMCDIIPGFRKRFPRKEVRRAIATGQYHHYSGTATWANDGLSTRELHACELEEEHKVRPFDIDRERASVHVREERPVRLSCEETNRYGGAPPAPRQIVVFFPYGTKSQKLKAGYCERIKPGAFGRAIRSGREINANVNHDGSQYLASTKFGNLTVSEVAGGVRFKIQLREFLPKHDTVLSCVRSGELDGCSPAWVKETARTRFVDEGGERVCEVLEADLTHIALTGKPYYTSTKGRVYAGAEQTGRTVATPPVSAPSLFNQPRQDISEIWRGY